MYCCSLKAKKLWSPTSGFLSAGSAPWRLMRTAAGLVDDPSVMATHGRYVDEAIAGARGDVPVPGSSVSSTATEDGSRHGSMMAGEVGSPTVSTTGVPKAFGHMRPPEPDRPPQPKLPPMPKTTGCRVKAAPPARLADDGPRALAMFIESRKKFFHVSRRVS